MTYITRGIPVCQKPLDMLQAANAQHGLVQGNHRRNVRPYVEAAYAMVPAQQGGER